MKYHVNYFALIFVHLAGIIYTPSNGAQMLSAPSLSMQDGPTWTTNPGVSPPPSIKDTLLSKDRVTYRESPPGLGNPSSLLKQENTTPKSSGGSSNIDSSHGSQFTAGGVPQGSSMVMPVDTDKILETYPFQPMHVEVPNAINAGNQALSQIQNKALELPGAIFGGPEALAQTASEAQHRALVTSKYMVLNSILGVQPAENTNMGEYRRVTQTPEINFQLTKQALPEDILASAGVLATSLSPGIIEQQKLADAEKKISDILQSEKKLKDEFNDSLLRNAFELSAVLDPKASGNIGMGTKSVDMTRKLKEQIMLKAPAIVSHQYFSPIKDRLDAMPNIKNGPAWFPRSGRTYKTAVLTGELASKRGIPDRVISRHSPSELEESGTLLGPLKQQIREQMIPQRLERLDV